MATHEWLERRHTRHRSLRVEPVESNLRLEQVVSKLRDFAALRGESASVRLDDISVDA